MKPELLTADDLDKLLRLVDLELDDREEQAKHGTQNDWEIFDRLSAEADPLKARIEATKTYLGRVKFASPEQIEAARLQFQDDETEIDDDALLSDSGDGGDPGYWVSAWVWVGLDQDEAEEE